MSKTKIPTPREVRELDARRKRLESLTECLRVAVVKSMHEGDSTAEHRYYGTKTDETEMVVAARALQNEMRSLGWQLDIAPFATKLELAWSELVPDEVSKLDVPA